MVLVGRGHFWRETSERMRGGRMREGWRTYPRRGASACQVLGAGLELTTAGREREKKTFGRRHLKVRPRRRASCMLLFAEDDRDCHGLHCALISDDLSIRFPCAAAQYWPSASSGRRAAGSLARVASDCDAYPSAPGCAVASASAGGRFGTGACCLGTWGLRPTV